MSKARRVLCAVYVTIAVLALVATWRQNLAFMAENPSGLTAFVPALLVNRASVSITVDIFIFALAATVWMVLESRRLGIRFVWLYVLLGMAVAVSVTFPLFLAARERRLAALGSTDTEPAPSASDRAGLALFGALIVGFAVWCTLR